ncbi:hypothetical protein [Sphaerisporangium sp. TRM90804]|uniref:hypothetical protein n=1 Tax=Sphaerisporangium sp. TRM90804 TaxID=3031113 RepID=UPI00244A9C61|nr:hypothetical protein [Sphaerisporangium sp. TRM90804]MDH2424751.1 hypothetical protein [Sphaerisporangium sp. TRM90804]
MPDPDESTSRRAWTEVDARFRVERVDGAKPPVLFSTLTGDGQADGSHALTEDHARLLGGALIRYANHCTCKSHT